MRIILSAHNSNHAPINKRNTVNLRAALVEAGIDFIPAIGCYNGKKETSFYTNCDTLAKVITVRALADSYGQECILRMLDDGSNCALVFPDNSQVSLDGTFKIISEFAAKQLENYTIIGRHYYAVA